MHLTNVAIQKHAPGFDASKVREGGLWADQVLGIDDAVEGEQC
jgi:hypothetical protein